MEVITDGIDHGAARTLEAGLIRSRINRYFGDPDHVAGNVKSTLAATGLRNGNRDRLPNRRIAGDGNLDQLETSDLWDILKSEGTIIYPQ